jgi:hypothetical protein
LCSKIMLAVVLHCDGCHALWIIHQHATSACTPSCILQK